MKQGLLWGIGLTAALLLAQPALAVAANTYTDSVAQAMQTQLAAINGLKMSGDVVATPSNNGTSLQLPDLHLKMGDGSALLLNGITAQLIPQTDDTWRVQFNWPATATRQSVNGAPLGVVAFGNNPKINGTWVQSLQGFSALSIAMQPVQFSDQANGYMAKLASLNLDGEANTTKGWGWKGGANDIQATMSQGEQGKVLNVLSVSMQQQLAGMRALNMEQLLQSLQAFMPQANNMLGLGQADAGTQNNLTSTVTFNNLTLNPVSKTSKAKGLAVRSATWAQSLGASGAGDTKRLNGTFNLAAKGVQASAGGIFDPVLPTELTAKGKLTDINPNAVKPTNNAQQNVLQLLTQSGGKLTIDQLNGTTQAGTALSGDGWLRAADTPAGVVGRLNMRFHDLNKAIEAFEAQAKLAAKSPEGRTDTANQPPAAQFMQQFLRNMAGNQAALGLQLLKSFGRVENVNGKEITRYLIDFTAEGATIVNGQDISALLAPVFGVRKFKQGLESVKP